ncbi:MULTISPECIES: hypothetical protein [unclassified Rickettsia]|uniref:hypothetical protein n=1 Tax=unclassified Rickettsia TaxID=114295 RepID=UPI003132FFC4
MRGYQNRHGEAPLGAVAIQLNKFYTKLLFSILIKSLIIFGIAWMATAAMPPRHDDYWLFLPILKLNIP